MRKTTPINQKTANHRADMLLTWRRRLLDPQMGFKTPKTTAMWRHIEIKNFKSIEHASVCLAPFSVVVGPNGSGKSNFVDALVFVRDVSLDASAAVSARGGIVGLRRWTKNKPTDVTIDVCAAANSEKLDHPSVRHFLKLHSGKEGEWSFSHEVVEALEASEPVERKNGSVIGPPSVGRDHQPTASVMVTAKQLKAFRAVSALHNVFRYRLNPEQMREPRLASDRARLSENGDNIATAVKSLKAHDWLP